MQQDKETTRNRQRQASTVIAMLLVGGPLDKYHWSTYKKRSLKFARASMSSMPFVAQCF